MMQRGYEELQAIVPTCQMSPDSVGSQKLSKATILQKCNASSIHYSLHFHFHFLCFYYLPSFCLHPFYCH